jgi:DNA-binding transcriptional MocR family regulator
VGSLSIKFAKRMDNIRASEIRELLKITQKPGYISFGGGFPAPELFPVEEMINITSKVLLKNGTKALQYGPTEGYPPLREAICRRMEKIHVNMAPDNILITSGSQQDIHKSRRQNNC